MTSIVDTAALLPCPFCGGAEHIYYKIERTPDDMREVPFYVCGQCAAEGAKPLGSWRIGEDASHEMALSAIAAWNRRASDPLTAELVEGLGEIAALLERAGKLHQTRDLREVIADPAHLAIRARALLAKVKGSAP